MNMPRDFRPNIIEAEILPQDTGVRADPRQRLDKAPPRFTHPAIGYRPPRHLVVIQRALIAAAGVAVLVASYVAYWFVSASTLRTGALEWAEGLRRQGYVIEYARMEVGGFPFKFRMALSGVEMAAPDRVAGWRWKTGAVTASAPPWNPGQVHADLSGFHEIGFKPGGVPLLFTGEASRLTLDFKAGRSWPSRFLLSGSGLLFASDDGSAVSARAFRLEVVPVSDTALTLALSGEEVVVPESLGLTFGPRIAGFGLEARLLGRLAGGFDARSLGAWRDDGGTAEIGKFNLAHGPLTLAASGTLALDEALQPVGTFTARFQGFFEVVDILRARGQILARDATTAKVVLGALAKRPEGGGPPTLTLPVTIRERTLFAGPVKFLTIPPIPWETVDHGSPP